MKEGVTSETSLRAAQLEEPVLVNNLRRLGLSEPSDLDLSIAKALELVALGTETAAVGHHVELWVEGCDVCWQTSGVVDIIDHVLTQHHEFLRRELPRIQTLLHRAVNREADPADTIARTVLGAFAPLKAEIEMHLLKEEQVLFPLAAQLEAARAPVESHCGSVRNPVGVMMMEHENAVEALQRMRSATGLYTAAADASPTMRALYAALAQLDRDLSAHIREEDNILFPRIVAIEDELLSR